MRVKVCMPISVHLKVYDGCVWSGVHSAKSMSVFGVRVCLMQRHVYVTGCAFASVKVCSVRERNLHLSVVPHSLGSHAETSQTDGTFLTAVAVALRLCGHRNGAQTSWARSTSSVHVWRQMH